MARKEKKKRTSLKWSTSNVAAKRKKCHQRRQKLKRPGTRKRYKPKPTQKQKKRVNNKSMGWNRKGRGADRHEKLEWPQGWTAAKLLRGKRKAREET